MEASRNRRRLSDANAAPVLAPAQVAPAASVPPHVVAQRRKRRSREIVDAVTRLDSCTDDQTRKELLEWTDELYAERDTGALVGLFGTCHLGHGYVDHLMDLAGGILTHYKPSDNVPPAFELARPLARNSAYLFIEVYSDGQVVPVRADGSVAL